MKKTALSMLVLALSFCLFGCGSQQISASSPTKMTTKQFKLLELSIPTDWEASSGDDEVIYYRSQEGMIATVAVKTGVSWSLDIEDEVSTDYFDRFKTHGVTVGTVESGSQGEALVFKAVLETTGEDAARSYLKLFLTGDSVYAVVVGAPSDIFASHEALLNEITDSAMLTETSKPNRASDNNG